MEQYLDVEGVDNVYCFYDNGLGLVTKDHGICASMVLHVRGVCG